MALLAAGALAAISASAAVDLRVQSRPISNPIEAYVTVTDSSGRPVGGLTAADFTVTLDGRPVTIASSGFSLPPALNPARNVSVVFVMDYSSSTEGDARIAMQDAVVGFIDSITRDSMDPIKLAMNVGLSVTLLIYNSNLATVGPAPFPNGDESIANMGFEIQAISSPAFPASP